jgi:hypothetical protein
MEAIAPSLHRQEHSNLRYYIESVRKRVTNLMLWRAIGPSLHISALIWHFLYSVATDSLINIHKKGS